MSKSIEVLAKNPGLGLVVGGVAVVGLAWLIFGGRLKAAAAAAAQAVNPTSDRNLAYRGVNAVGAAVTGSDSFSLGSWLYDVTHPGENAALIRARTAATTGDDRTWWQGIKETIGGG